MLRSKIRDFFIFFTLMLVLNSFVHSAGIINGLVFTTLGLQYCLGMVFIGPRNASLVKIYSLFGYIFFSILPMIELNLNVVYWGGAQFEQFDYAIAGLVLFFLNSIFYIFYQLKYVGTRKVDVNEQIVNFPSQVLRYNLNNVGVLVILLSSLLVLYIVLQQNDFNILSPLLRGGDLVERAGFSSSVISLFYSSVIRFVPMSFFLGLLFFVKGRPLLKVVTFLIALYCVFPTGIPRLRVPTYYLPIILFAFPGLLMGRRLLMLIAAGILIVFPTLEMFRRFDPGNGVFFRFVDYNFLVAGHFDAFQNFVRILTTNFITYGQQFLGVIFFWVPRSLWENKPIGTGHTLALEYDYVFSNISATFYAEGWANFGLIGALLAAAFLGLLLAILDSKFWKCKIQSDDYTIFYYVFLGYLFFFLRGDLLSATSYLIGTVVTIVLTNKIIFSFSSTKN